MAILSETLSTETLNYRKLRNAEAKPRDWQKDS